MSTEEYQKDNHSLAYSTSTQQLQHLLTNINKASSHNHNTRSYSFPAPIAAHSNNNNTNNSNNATNTSIAPGQSNPGVISKSVTANLAVSNSPSIINSRNNSLTNSIASHAISQLYSSSYSTKHFPVNPLRRVQSSKYISNQPQSTHDLEFRLNLLTSKYRELELEVSRLNALFNEKSSNSSEVWSIRYSRRLVLICNLLLALQLFIETIIHTFKHRNKLFHHKYAHLAEKLFINSYQLQQFSPYQKNKPVPLSLIVMISIFRASLNSFIFILSFLLYSRTTAFQRNFGLLASINYSLYLLLFHRYKPRFLLILNILANCVCAVLRYYYLHGLLVFNALRIL
jgi:hypothetical protein